eukprot:NODE_878_length_3486_cov_0.159433.p1 type:complete len:386 gc:universal NODE_878_length_3486_cov_0.159433:1120-2277(+)
MSQNLEQLVIRLEKAVDALEGKVSKQPASSQSVVPQSSDKMVEQFLNVSNQAMGELTKFGNALSDDSLSKTIELVKQGVTEVAMILRATLECTKPTSPTYAQGIQKIAASLQEVKNKYATTKKNVYINVVNALVEGFNTNGWVTISPTPVPFINELKDAAQFFSNRALKEFKEKDETVVSLLTVYFQYLSNDLVKFVKDYHTTGLNWKGKGNVDEFLKRAPVENSASTPVTTAPAVVRPSGAGLFSELNKGGEITSGLKKVEKSQMTHKNPELRASGVVKAVEKETKVVNKKPPVFELQGSKWVVENQVGNKSIVIDDCNLKQVVYIFNCQNSVIQIKGKVNSVSLDNCNKTAVVVESVVSTVDSVNCKSIQIQITGSAPTVNLN